MPLFHLYKHPFIDGNRRVGANSGITFPLTSDWVAMFMFEEKELLDLVLSVASGCLGKTGPDHHLPSRLPAPDAQINDGCRTEMSERFNQSRTPRTKQPKHDWELPQMLSQF